MTEDDLISIGTAAALLGVSIDTLRRWDKNGTLVALKTPGSHRVYSRRQIALLTKDLFTLAKTWAKGLQGEEPPDEFYCQNSAVFQARLMTLERDLDQGKDTLSWRSLIVSAIGEIGNNSFDHNIGNWPDVPGIFFGYDLSRRIVVLSDRGRGVRATLCRVKPTIVTNADALQVAFTEVLSGRAPESRGNGLKLVRMIAERYPISIDFYSGNAKISLRNGAPMTLTTVKDDDIVRGCLVRVTF